MPTDTERLKFLIDREAFIEEDFGCWYVWERNRYGDDDCLTEYRAFHKTPEEAIDAAMERFK